MTASVRRSHERRCACWRRLRRASGSASSWTSARSAAPPSTPAAIRSRTPRARPASARTPCCSGAVGGPRWNSAAVRPEQGLLALRSVLGCYANLRPARRYTRHTTSPLRDELVAEPRPRDRARADRRHLLRRSRARRRGRLRHLQLQRRSRSAASSSAPACIAERRSGRVTSVDKANVLATSKLWRRVASEVAERHPGVTLEHQLVDSMAMLLVERPGRLRRDRDREPLRRRALRPRRRRQRRHRPRALGLARRRRARHLRADPRLGARHRRAAARPIPPARSSRVALLLDELGQPAAARAIERAVTGVLDDGARTPDLGGTATTDEVAAEIADALSVSSVHRQLTDRESSYVHRREAARLRRGAPAQSLRRPTPHRRGGRYPLARDVRRRDLLRDPRRGDPSDLRRARLDGNEDQARAGAPRAGRRPHGAGLRARDRQGRRRHGDVRARARRISSRRSPTRSWTRRRS